MSTLNPSYARWPLLAIPVAVALAVGSVMRVEEMSKINLDLAVTVQQCAQPGSRIPIRASVIRNELELVDEPVTVEIWSRGTVAASATLDHTAANDAAGVLTVPMTAFPPFELRARAGKPEGEHAEVRLLLSPNCTTLEIEERRYVRAASKEFTCTTVPGMTVSPTAAVEGGACVIGTPCKVTVTDERTTIPFSAWIESDSGADAGEDRATARFSSMQDRSGAPMVARIRQSLASDSPLLVVQYVREVVVPSAVSDPANDSGVQLPLTTLTCKARVPVDFGVPAAPDVNVLERKGETLVLGVVPLGSDTVIADVFTRDGIWTQTVVIPPGTTGRVETPTSEPSPRIQARIAGNDVPTVVGAVDHEHYFKLPPPITSRPALVAIHDARRSSVRAFAVGILALAGLFAGLLLIRRGISAQQQAEALFAAAAEETQGPAPRPNRGRFIDIALIATAAFALFASIALFVLAKWSL